ncbi:MAG: hypothetical protein ACLFPQ_04210 [Candidatus Woesearchaeota archaeon]
MAETIVLVLGIIAVLIVLGILNSVLGIISKINVRNILIVLVIAGGLFYIFGDSDVFREFDTSSVGRISGAVVNRIGNALPEYRNTNETCSEIEDEQDLPDRYKRIRCDSVCGEERNVGNRCIDDAFFCQCW